MASPTDVAGLNAWFKADAITGLIDGDPVGTWVESQSAADATQGTAAKKPVYKTGQINGLPVVRFDGVDDFMQSTASASLAAQTVFVVANVTAAATIRTLRGAVGTGGLQHRITATDFQMLLSQSVAAIATSTSAVTEGAAKAWTVSHADAATYAFYTGGTLDGSGSHAVTLTAGRQTTIGVNYDLVGPSFAEFMLGDIAEIIVYNSVLSAGNRATVHSYIQDKYAITVSDYVPSVFTNKSAMRQMLNFGRM